MREENRLMTDKDLKKLSRTELVEILCRQREMMDELSKENRSLQARAKDAEGKCAQYAARLEEESDRQAADEALREEMRQALRKIDAMSCAVQHCGEADRRIAAAETEAEQLLAQAREEAERLRQEAIGEIEQRREAFTRQCEELLRGQEMLRRLMEN